MFLSLVIFSRHIFLYVSDSMMMKCVIHHDHYYSRYYADYGRCLSAHTAFCSFPLTSLLSAVLSIMGNLLVLIMAFKRSSKMKPPELLSVNLAVTDLGAAVTMYPLAVASAWSHRWLGGDAICTYYSFVGFFFGVASIMNLTVLAIVRLIVSLNLQSPGKSHHTVSLFVDVTEKVVNCNSSFLCSNR